MRCDISKKYGWLKFSPFAPIRKGGRLNMAGHSISIINDGNTAARIGSYLLPPNTPLDLAAHYPNLIEIDEEVIFNPPPVGEPADNLLRVSRLVSDNPDLQDAFKHVTKP